MKVFPIILLTGLLTFGFSKKLAAVDQPNQQIEKYLEKASGYFNQIPDSCVFYAQKALGLAQKLNLPKYISLAQHKLGAYYVSKEDYIKATQYFLDAIKIEEQRKDPKRIASLNSDLGLVYSYLENFNKALTYYSGALETYQKLKDTIYIAGTLSRIGFLYRSREFCEKRTEEQKHTDFNTALQYTQKALKLFEQQKNASGITVCNNNLGTIYSCLGQPDKATRYIKAALDYYRQHNSWDDIAGTLYNLGRTYNVLKDYRNALDCFNESLKIAKEHNLTGGIQFLYEAMSDAYTNAKDYKNARDFYVKYMTIRDSVYNAEKSKQMFELETRYQAEKKEKEIIRLTLLKKRRDLWIIILTGSFIITLLGGMYAFSRIRSKRIIAEQTNRINEQRIKELEKHQQLIATQMVLQGEETERSRLARDLHDGLGGLLSGVKLTLSGIKGNVLLSPESVNSYNKALNMLDSSIQELRRVAHNMMPEALVKFGLKDALSDFCHGIANHEIEIKFQHFGADPRFESKIEIGIYRIAQELINNALKHSRATLILVQLIQEDDRVCLTIQDNGKGFDVEILKTSKGAGIANIRSRVESLNGVFDLISKPEKGTEATIEFHANKLV